MVLESLEELVRRTLVLLLVRGHLLADGCSNVRRSHIPGQDSKRKRANKARRERVRDTRSSECVAA